MKHQNIRQFSRNMISPSRIICHMTINMAAALQSVNSFLASGQLKPLLSVFKGLRNGAVYVVPNFIKCKPFL